MFTKYNCIVCDSLRVPLSQEQASTFYRKLRFSTSNNAIVPAARGCMGFLPTPFCLGFHFLIWHRESRSRLELSARKLFIFGPEFTNSGYSDITNQFWDNFWRSNIYIYSKWKIVRLSVTRFNFTFFHVPMNNKLLMIKFWSLTCRYWPENKSDIGPFQSGQSVLH